MSKVPEIGNKEGPWATCLSKTWSLKLTKTWSLRFTITGTLGHRFVKNVVLKICKNLELEIHNNRDLGPQLCQKCGPRNWQKSAPRCTITGTLGHSFVKNAVPKICKTRSPKLAKVSPEIHNNRDLGAQLCQKCGPLNWQKSGPRFTITGTSGHSFVKNVVPKISKSWPQDSQ